MTYDIKPKWGFLALLQFCILANYFVLQWRRGMFCYNWANWDGFAGPWQFSDGGAVLLLDEIIQCANTMQIQQQYNANTATVQYKYSANTMHIQCKYNATHNSNTIQIQQQ